MTDHRWTVEADGDITCNLFVVKIIPPHGSTLYAERKAAYDALVAAVRDADTLRQARQLAVTIIEGRKGGFSTREFADKAELALLDLLSPPAVPDTPTPTGQT